MQERLFGLAMTVAGLGVIVFALVLVGVTETDGDLDWVGGVTAAAGVVMTIMGVLDVLRSHRPGPSPHGT
jgi:hypothetical protein